MLTGRTVCVDNETSSGIHRVVRRRFERAIHIKEVDFRPEGPKGRNGLFLRAARLGQRTLGV
jgi:hypothetical protein